MALANILRTDAHLHRMLPDDSRAGPVDHRARPRLPGRGVAAHQAGAGTAGPAARVLPRLPGRVRRRLRLRRRTVDHPAGQPGRPRGARDRAQPRRRPDACPRPGSRPRCVAAAGSGASAAWPRASSPRCACPQLRQDPMVEQAMRAETLALLGVLDAVCASVDQLAAAAGRGVRAASGLRDHHQLPRPGRHQRRDRARRDRRRPHPVRRRPGAAGLRRLRPGHPSLRQVPDRDPAADEEQPARRDRLLAGRSPPPLDRHRPASTTCAAANAATGTPPRCGTCSTGCSANCTTAWPPARPTTRPRPSRTPRHDTCRAGRGLTVGDIGGLKRSVVLWVEGGDGPVSVAGFIASQRAEYRVPVTRRLPGAGGLGVLVLQVARPAAHAAAGAPSRAGRGGLGVVRGLRGSPTARRGCGWTCTRPAGGSRSTPSPRSWPLTAGPGVSRRGGGR